MTEPGALHKSADAYRTISEVAADLKLPQHVLRFWETRFSQVKPLKRAGGRRFYRPEDVDLLRAVKALLYGDGYTIKGVQRLLREQGPKAVAALAASRSHGRPSRPPALIEIDAAVPTSPSARRLDLDSMAAVIPIVSPAAEHDLRSAGETPLDAATRLRAVLADLGDCARLLSTVRTASR